MSDNSNASTMMVALIAIVVIIAIGFIVLRLVPATNTDDINVTIPTDVVNPGEDQ